MRKSVLIIGASGGIGGAIARKFAQEGFNVIATYNNGSLDGLSDYCLSKGVNFNKIKMDVTNLNEVKQGILTAFKGADYLDCVIYASGISTGEKMLIDEDYGDINKLIDINLKGAIFVAKESMRFMEKNRHGNIIFISSIYGIYGGSCESIYSATKGGLIALTKALSMECASFGVRVNAIAPGYVQSDMTKSFTENEKEAIKESTPLKRLGEGEDVAGAVYFLSSCDASFITGEVISVSGGALRF